MFWRPESLELTFNMSLVKNQLKFLQTIAIWGTKIKYRSFGAGTARGGFQVKSVANANQGKWS